MPARMRATGTVERVLALRAFPGFARLPTDHLAGLAECTVERDVRRGEALALSGTPVPSVFFIRRGRVHVVHEGVAVRSFTGGAVVGGLAGLTRDPEGQHLVAAEDTDVFEVAVEDMEDFLEDSFPTLTVVMQGLAQGVRELRRQLPRDAGYRDDAGEFLRSERALGLVERVLFARNLLAFGRARVEAMAELVRDMAIARFRAGQVLYREDDEARDSLLIYSGAVRCASSSGQRFLMGPDSQIGGVDALARARRWYTATAETDVVALRSDVTNLLDTIEDHPDMGLDIVRVLARTMKTLQYRVYAEMTRVPPAT
jgi:CRP-like cAMP-binding protein